MTNNKTFKQFVTEAADHHEAGKKILDQHASNKTVHPDTYENQHVVTIHKDKVAALHKKLAGSGWKHEGVVAHGGHRFTKGSSMIDIEHHANCDAEGYPGNTHHSANVFTKKN